MTQGPYLSILQVGVMKIIEWYCFNFDVPTLPPQTPDLHPMVHVWALCETEIKRASNTTQRNVNCGSVCKLLSIPSLLSSVTLQIIVSPCVVLQ